MNNILLLQAQTNDNEKLGMVLIWASIILFLLIGLTKVIELLRTMQKRVAHWNNKRVHNAHAMTVPHQKPRMQQQPVERKRKPMEYPVTGETIPLKPVDVSQNPYAVAGVPQALKCPPTDFNATLDRLSDKPYSFPIGWSIDGLQDASFVGDVNHIALTGQSDSGKDNAALGILLGLAAYHTPEQVQFALIDGKGLDWIDFESKAHTWLLAAQAEDIPNAMERLTAERKRRYEILRKAKVLKWDQYQGGDLPLLVVFVSELSLLEGAVGKKSELTDWLNAELTSARAFGIRYIIAAQTMSNFDTRWRSQLGLYIAGYQPNESQDVPNCGFSSKELLDRGTCAPSDLPVPTVNDHKGVFCVVKGRDSINVRTALISPEQRTVLLSMLPDRDQEPTTDLLERLVSDNSTVATVEPVGRSESHVEANSTTTATESEVQIIGNLRIPTNEVVAILNLAKAGYNKSKASQQLYNTSGGANWNKVKAVYDHHGF